MMGQENLKVNGEKYVVVGGPSFVDGCKSYIVLYKGKERVAIRKDGLWEWRQEEVADESEKP